MRSPDLCDLYIQFHFRYLFTLSLESCLRLEVYRVTPDGWVAGISACLSATLGRTDSKNQIECF